MSQPPKSNPETSEWYYQLLGLSTGPVDSDRLKWMIAHNHLGAASLVGRSESGPWQRLDQSPLAHLLSKTQAGPATSPSAESKEVTPSPRKKKATRMSSGKRQSEKTVPPPTAPQDEANYVAMDGIEIEAPVEDPVTPAPRHSGNAKPVAREREAPKPEPESEPASTRSAQPPVLDDLEVVEDDAAAGDGFETEARTETPSQRLRREYGLRPTAPKQSEQILTPERQKFLTYTATALGLALLALIVFSLFAGGADGEEAFLVFRRIGNDVEFKAERLDDADWARFLKASQDEVEAVLEPLRDEIDADQPRLQALVWAGDQLMSMLQGNRKIPRPVKAKFEAFMSEYLGEPVPQIAPTEAKTTDGDKSDNEANNVTDPIFN